MMRFALILLATLVLVAAAIELVGHTHGFWLYAFAIVLAQAGSHVILRPDWTSWGIAVLVTVVGAGLFHFADPRFAWICACGLGLVVANATVTLEALLRRR